MVNMFNRFSRYSTIFCFFNIFCLLTNLHAQEENECLDLNKINSSVDAGSFYNIDASIKQLEENMTKITQELKQLKQHIEFAKITEQKRMLQVQKLEKENTKTSKSWLENSFDNSWTGSSSKLENSGNPNRDTEVAITTTVTQPNPGQGQTTKTIQPIAETQAIRQDIIVQVIEQ